ncbi:hypothetical protein [Flavobacterium sp. 2]|uniref:hypothetical protein n=1 Tax=Flavobacterium sp. 2 TaxID=308053 RepID=UPI003CF849D1
MLNRKIDFRIMLLFLLFFCTAIKAQTSENEPPPGFDLGEKLNEVPVDAYDPPSTPVWDYASNYWDQNANDYIGSNNDYYNEQYSTGPSNPGYPSGGGSGGEGGAIDRQTVSQLVLSKKVKPGETHTQSAKVLRDPNTSTSKKVVDLVVNGEKVGTVTLSDPIRDTKGVDIYSKLTVQVFANSPIAITSITVDNPETSKYNDSQHSTNNNLQVVWADTSIYKDFGIVNFTTPINEEEDFVITGNSTAATNSPTNIKDPCVLAKELTTLGANPVFQKAVQDIKNTPDFYNKESGITLGKNAGGQIYADTMNPGEKSNVAVNHSIQGFFTNLHNHPNSTIHSGKDLSNITVLSKLYPSYIGSFVIPNKEEVYAAVVTDLAAAQVFVATYLTDSKTKAPAHYPKFMYQEMSNVFENLNSYSIESESRAKAFVLDKYNSGITFLRQGTDGKFYPLKIKETKQANDSVKYELIPCS